MARQREPAALILCDLNLPEVLGGFLPTVCHYLIAYLRSLIQAAQTRPLDGRDMDEHVLAASVG
jgi:hypothetical protein